MKGKVTQQFISQFQQIREKDMVTEERAKELFKIWYVKNYDNEESYKVDKDNNIILSDNINENFDFRDYEMWYESDGRRWATLEVFVCTGKKFGLHSFVIPLDLGENAILQGKFKKIKWNTRFDEIKITNAYRRERPFVSVVGTKMEDFMFKQQMIDPELRGEFEKNELQTNQQQSQQSQQKEKIEIPSVSEVVEQQQPKLDEEHRPYEGYRGRYYHRPKPRQYYRRY